MCGGGGGTPKAPPTPAALPEAPRTPEQPTGAADTTGDKRRRALAAGQSRTGTILTGARGVTEQANTAQKTLLGA